MVFASIVTPLYIFEHPVAPWQRVLEEDARAGRAINRMKEIWFGV